MFRSAARPLIRLLAQATIALSVATLSACTTFQPGRADRLTAAPAIPIPEDQWPARKMEDLAEKARSSPREIFARLFQTVTIDQRPAFPERAFRSPRFSFSGVYGRGILRVTDISLEQRDSTTQAPRTAAVMRFYSFSERPDRPADSRFTEYAERQLKALRKRLDDAGEKLSDADVETLRVMSEGTAIRVTAPPGAVPTRGTIVYMAGLGSAEYEQPLIDELNRRGWWILKVATPRVWWYESRPWMIASKAEIPVVAEKLAGVMDDLVAEPAYAAEAALRYLQERRPEIPLSPLVMVGCSAGALAAPAVIARMPDRFDAAILVGGGANLLQISQTSDLTDGGIRLTYPDNQPRGGWRSQLFRDYLTFSKLDPYHTARFLRNKPTLLVQANLDITVPASNGWLLWDRLGRPDRYEHVGEHRTLFLTLAGQSKRIASWLDGKVAALPSHAPVAQTPAAPPPPALPNIGGGAGSTPVPNTTLPARVTPLP